MSDAFTQHVREFGTSGENTDLFWKRFKLTLRSELSARNLFHQPPTLLGYESVKTWGDPSGFEDLAIDCYIAAVLKRMHSLKALLNHRASVAGAVRQNIKYFLIDRQRSANQIGYKLFKNVESILNDAIASGEFTVEGPGGGKLRNQTLLRLEVGGSREPISRVQLDQSIDDSEAWSHVIRTIAGPETGARQPLLDALRSSGVAAVRIGDLVNALRQRADAADRSRKEWGEARGVVGIIRTIPPDTRYEEDESRRERMRRIREKVGHLNRGSRVKERILQLFERLVSLEETASELVWEDVYTAVGISRSTFWEYIHVLRSIVKEIEEE